MIINPIYTLYHVEYLLSPNLLLKGSNRRVTLPETNIFAPENRPGPKGKLIFQPYIFKCERLLVSGRVKQLGAGTMPRVFPPFSL